MNIKIDSRIYDKTVITDYKVQRLFSYLMSKLPDKVDFLVKKIDELPGVYVDSDVTKITIDLKDIDSIMEWSLSNFATDLLKKEKAKKDKPE